MAHLSHPNIWGDLERGGARFLALEGARSLFIERSDAPGSLSAETARKMNTLGACTSGEAVWLLDHDDQIELLVDVSRARNVSVKDFSTIRTVGLSPKLSSRLMSWAVQQRRPDGLCLVDVRTATPRHDEAYEFLVDQILEPWITRRRFNAGGSEAAPSDQPRFEIWLELLEQINKASGNLALSAAKGLTQSLVAQLKHGRADADIDPLLDEGLQKARSIEEALRSLLQSNGFDVVHFAAHGGSDVIQGSYHLSHRIRALEEAKKDFDSVYSFLLTAEDRSASAVKPKRPPKDERSAPDPVDNAIAIRKRLQSTVNLLDASKWAQWRGIESVNPSAALGKYKQKRRLFAVRSGNRDLYPAFQFSDNAEPLPIIEDILKVVPEEAQGWALLSWFEAGNVLLKGRKPSEVLLSDPQAVREAAARFYSRED